ncbi:MAG: aldo/keto reductase [Polyangiaceae bacterium]|nr:aldo/keto reductase [Myxococcales bacterium]MCB9584974.1 aldo/keto reductase [Polyangiaceae bacterium]MCB9607453.1 aldo/keto reductase [Polyangiaceae bacterium]
MKQLTFGNSGLRISELCLGAITFGDPRSFGTSAEESLRMLGAFADAGGTFIDTAHLYAAGESERLVGEFISSDRHNYVVSTKYTPAREGGPRRAGNGRKNMLRSIDESLRRLNTDYIDVYWLHARDNETPWQEILRGLDDLVRMGKVLYVAVSDTPAWDIARAHTLSELRGWSSFVGIQVEFSLVERSAERDLFPMAAALGLGVTAWAPLAAGVLSGKYAKPGSEPTRLQANGIPERSLRIAKLVSEIAAQVEATPAQVALAWIQHQRVGQSRVIPILGARTLEQLQQNLGCLDVKLTPEQLARLDAETRQPLGFPHEFLQSEMMRRFLSGGEPDALEGRHA